MKKYIFLFVAFWGLASWSCSEDEDQKQIPVIELIAPADNASIDLAEVANVSFSWKAVEGITGYTLVLSNSEDLSSPQEITATATPFAVTAEILNAKVASLGVSEGATAKVYWSVKPNSGEAKSQTRALTITRKSTVIPTIALLDPADGVTIDANVSAFSCSFKWNGVPGVNNYTLKFSLGDKNETEEIGDFTQRQYAVDEFEELLSKLGVKPNQSATITWTVIPTHPDASAVTQTRSFTAVRKNLALVSPENDTAIALNYKTPDATATTFEWTPQSGVSSYTLLIGTNPNLSDASQITVTGASKAFTHAELQAWIDNQSIQLKRYLENTLYWNVKTNDATVSAEPGTFKLSGMQAFVDVRGSESITYEVSVITYLNGTKTVWLSSDLKAKRYVDGNRIGEWTGENREIFVPGEGEYADVEMCMESPTKRGGTRTAFSGDPIPQANLNNMGIYYNQGHTDAFAKVIPVGWRMPKKADFNNLYDAALATEGGLAVLKTGDCYPEEDQIYFNQWNMNIAANGRFMWAFWGWAFDPNSWFYNMDNEGGTENRGSCVWGSGTPDERSWPEDTTGALVRVIYDGF